MAKQRLAVVVLVPDPWATEIDGIRKALGDPQLARIDPHITIVPPVNVRDEDLADAVAVLRAAAASVDGPVGACLGPIASFAPASPVLHLAVDPPDAMADLNRACLRGPLERTSDHAFTPHVTVDINRPDEQHASALDLLSSYVTPAISFDRLTLMHLPSTDGRGRWEPLADVVFGSEHRVSAGSVELSITESTLLDPPAAAALGVRTDDVLGRGRGDGIIVTARNRDDDAVIAIAAGRRRGRRASVLRSVFVLEPARGQGVGRRLVEAWERAATAGGAVRSVAPGVSDEVTGLLEHLGWGTTEPILDRRYED